MKNNAQKMRFVKGVRILYEAIFVPKGMDAPPYEIINQPELQVYVKYFGRKKGDICFVSEHEGKIVGAVWVRIMDDYGHVNDETPSFVISLLKEYRNYGIGTTFSRGVPRFKRAER